MCKTTRATDLLKKSGVAFSVHPFDYDPNADRIGLQVMALLDDESVFVTVLRTTAAPLTADH